VFRAPVRGSRVASCAAAIALCLASTQAAQAQSPSPRIVGGSVAPASDYPFVGAVVVTGGSPRQDAKRQICGATLVRPDVAITAAHCTLAQRGLLPFVPATKLTLVFGKSVLNSPLPGDRAVVNQISVPTGFSLFDLGPGDVAVLHLANPVPERPASIPAPGTATSSVVGSTAFFAGWGVRRPRAFAAANALREGSGIVAPQKSCRLPKFLKATLGFLCLARRSFGAVCHGDSGSPLLVGDNLVGVTNFTLGNCGARGGTEGFASLLPSSPNYAFVSQVVANRDITAPALAVDTPLPNPMRRSTRRRHPLAFHASEPVRAFCIRGRRAVECGSGTNGLVAVIPGRRVGPGLIRIIAFDQSFNRTELDYSFNVGP
jgi:hypothetical protein